MSVEDNTPVILGVGQVTERIDQEFIGLSPEALATKACERALLDTGSANAIRVSVDKLACVRLFADSVPDEFTAFVAPFGSSNSPPQSIIDQLGMTGVEGLYSRACGDEPQRLIHELSDAVANGEIKGALLCGAEAMATVRHWQRSGRSADWSDAPSGVTEDRGMATDFLYERELNRHGAHAPIDVYPLLENARRGELGLSKEEYRDQIASLLCHFANVADKNPFSMFQKYKTYEEIATETVKNRMISDPHLKAMVAKDRVNQAAAIAITSFGLAKSLGVTDRAIFLRGYSDSVELPVLERPSLARAPEMREAYQAAMASAGLKVEDLMAFDLYSCFPIAVFCAIDSLGLKSDDLRPLTLTGGLPFFGGPGNNYSTHGIAEMIHLLRAQTSPAHGLIGANGGYLSKHSVGIYSNEPGPFPAAHSNLDRVKKRVKVEVTCRPSGTSRVESYTIRPKGASPQIIVVSRQERDSRRWVGVADSNNSAVQRFFHDGEPLGARVEAIVGDQNVVRMHGL